MQLKKIFIILVMLLISNIKAQQIENRCNIHSFADFEQGIYYKDVDNKFAPFIGVWKNVTGNTTFKVTMFKTEDTDYGGYFLDTLEGHYEIILNEGQANENIICTSRFLPGNPSVQLPPLIQGSSCSGNGFGGSVLDMCIGPPKYQLNGMLQISLIPGTNTAHWKITRKRGLVIGQEIDYTLPKDIILTKQ